MLSFKFFFKLGVFGSCEWHGVKTFGQRGGALDLFLPLSSKGVGQDGLRFPASLWAAVPWHRRDLVGEREGDHSQLCAYGILLKRC